MLIGPTYEVNVANHSRLGDPATAAAAEDDYNQKRAGILTNPAADFLGGPQLSLIIITSDRPYDVRLREAACILRQRFDSPGTR